MKLRNVQIGEKIIFEISVSHVGRMEKLIEEKVPMRVASLQRRTRKLVFQVQKEKERW